jgi:hypothetical protein
VTKNPYIELSNSNYYFACDVGIILHETKHMLLDASSVHPVSLFR